MPIEFRPLPVGPLATNCYLIWDRDIRSCAIIDPGGAPNQIAYRVNQLGLSVEWILLTHGHFDHAFYAGRLANEYDVNLAMHASDQEQLTETYGIAETLYDMSELVPVTPTDFLTDGQVIRLGESDITVLHTPGHSQGGICFVADAGVFCGDTIFAGSVGRSDFPGGSHEQLIESIATKLLTLDDATPLYPGHGPATTVGNERCNNPYL